MQSSFEFVSCVEASDWRSFVKTCCTPLTGRAYAIAFPSGDQNGGKTNPACDTRRVMLYLDRSSVFLVLYEAQNAPAIRPPASNKIGITYFHILRFAEGTVTPCPVIDADSEK